MFSSKTGFIRRVMGIAVVAAVMLNFVTPSSVLAVNDTVPGNARGYLTTPQELIDIRVLADPGQAPYTQNVDDFFNYNYNDGNDSTTIKPLNTATGWLPESNAQTIQNSDTQTCYDGDPNPPPRGPRFLVEGSRIIYGKAIAAHLKTGQLSTDYALSARTRIYDFLDTTTWGGSSFTGANTCILYLSWYVPSLVMAADLLEDFPQVWSAQDKQSFQNWLATQVYPKVAWASRERKNNWGSSGSYAAAMIADYLLNRAEPLQEISPMARTLSPAEAYAQHNALQLNRMNTQVAFDSDCALNPPLGNNIHGIQNYGGIPDELRRAIEKPLLSTVSIPEACAWRYLPQITEDKTNYVRYDKAYGYQQTQVEAFIAHAEFLLRRGDSSLYDNGSGSGTGSILQAIKFITANPEPCSLPKRCS